jgi:hypothetical protein
MAATVTGRQPPARPSYDYVRRAYGVDPKVGARVRHTVTGKAGTIARENQSSGHYVQVLFDGKGFAMPCHPTELDYSPKED